MDLKSRQPVTAAGPEAGLIGKPSIFAELERQYHAAWYQNDSHEELATTERLTAIEHAHIDTVRHLFGLDRENDEVRPYVFVSGVVDNNHPNPAMDVGRVHVSDVFEAASVALVPTESGKPPRTVVNGFIKRPGEAVDEIFITLRLDGDAEIRVPTEEEQEMYQLIFGAVKWWRSHHGRSGEPEGSEEGAPHDEVAQNFRKVSPASFVDAALSWYGGIETGLPREFKRLQEGQKESKRAEIIVQGLVKGLLLYGIENRKLEDDVSDEVYQKLQDIGDRFAPENRIYFHVHAALALERELTLAAGRKYWRQQYKQLHESNDEPSLWRG